MILKGCLISHMLLTTCRPCHNVDERFSGNQIFAKVAETMTTTCTTTGDFWKIEGRGLDFASDGKAYTIKNL